MLFRPLSGANATGSGGAAAKRGTATTGACAAAGQAPLLLMLLPAPAPRKQGLRQLACPYSCRTHAPRGRQPVHARHVPLGCLRCRGAGPLLLLLLPLWPALWAAAMVPYGCLQAAGIGPTGGASTCCGCCGSIRSVNWLAPGCRSRGAGEHHSFEYGGTGTHVDEHEQLKGWVLLVQQAVHCAAHNPGPNAGSQGGTAATVLPTSQRPLTPVEGSCRRFYANSR